MDVDKPSKQEQRNERKRKLQPATFEKKKVCVDSYSWWTNMMLDVAQGEHLQVSTVTTRKLQWNE